jgi:hypothetical protein
MYNGWGYWREHPYALVILSIPQYPFAERHHNRTLTSHNFQDSAILQETGVIFTHLPYNWIPNQYIHETRKDTIMNLAEKAEEMAEQKIYEEGGYPALWKYKTLRLFKKCGCM